MIRKVRNRGRIFHERIGNAAAGASTRGMNNFIKEHIRELPHDSNGLVTFGKLKLTEGQVEQFMHLFMGIRNGEAIYQDDDGNFHKHQMGPLEGEDRDANDPVSSDDESYL